MEGQLRAPENDGGDTAHRRIQHEEFRVVTGTARDIAEDPALVEDVLDGEADQRADGDGQVDLMMESAGQT